MHGSMSKACNVLAGKSEVKILHRTLKLERNAETPER
jgi:hypothetical protein